MTNKLFEKTRPAWKWLPIGSYIDAFQRAIDGEHITPLKGAVHIIYGLAVPIYLGLHLMGAIPTKAEKLTSEEKRERYVELEKSIFKEYGYADVNNDGNIDAKEKFDAYTLMGLNSIIVWPGKKPTINELEQAVEYYQTGDRE
ncbi:MAG: hypothetical protein KJI69_06285 [Patescibacteria group bacterium]|nr:hypothetical protein [Patescibacteria group bacterium]